MALASTTYIRWGYITFNCFILLHTTEIQVVFIREFSFLQLLSIYSNNNRIEDNRYLYRYHDNADKYITGLPILQIITIWRGDQQLDVISGAVLVVNQLQVAIVWNERVF